MSFCFKKSVFQLLGFAFLIAFTLVGCRGKKILTDSSTSRGKVVKGSLKERYAAVLEVRERDIKNEKLYRLIDDWLGVKHLDGGGSKRGIDCSGFTLMLEKEIYDKELPRTARAMAEQVKRKYEDELREGDLVFFDFGGRKFSHVGVYLQNNKFVHVSTSRGVIISNLKDSWYYKYFTRAGGVKELPANLSVTSR